MRKIIYFFLTFITLFSCNAQQKNIEVETVFGGVIPDHLKNIAITIDSDKDEWIVTDQMPIDLDELKIFVFRHKSWIERISGLEKLSKMKQLYIGGYGSVEDFSFLKNMPKLKTLFKREISNTCNIMEYLSFLPDLQNLLLTGEYNMSSPVIDFEYNQKLEFVNIVNPAVKGKDWRLISNTSEGFNIINVPTTLKTLILQFDHGIFFSDDFFENIKRIPNVYIILEKVYTNDSLLDELRKYTNIHCWIQAADFDIDILKYDYFEEQFADAIILNGEGYKY